jgi:hypothetical protein
LFNSSSAANLATVNDLTGLTLNKITLANPTGAVSIIGNSLVLGAGGIDLSAATANMTINTLLTLTASQSWNVNSGRTLTITGGVSGTGAVTLNGVAGPPGLSP